MTSYAEQYIQIDGLLISNGNIIIAFVAYSPL